MEVKKNINLMKINKWDNTILLLKFIKNWLKAEAVINSCNTIAQLDSAYKYVILFNNFHHDSYSYEQLCDLIEEKKLLIKY